MTADKDTDTESVVDGEIFDPDIHEEYEEFFDCSGEAYDYDNASDSDDDLSDIPELIPRGRNSRESEFLPPLKDYKHTGIRLSIQLLHSIRGEIKPTISAL